MGRGLGDLQRNMLAMAYVNHRDVPERPLARLVEGPDDDPLRGNPYARPTYPYWYSPTPHLFYFEPLAWLYGFRDSTQRHYYSGHRDATGWHRGFWSKEHRPVPRNSHVHALFDIRRIGERRFRAAQVAVTRAMQALDGRGLVIYRDGARPTGIVLRAEGLEEARRIYESGRCDRPLVDTYAAGSIRQSIV